jgi:hypothetical protein
MYRRAAERADDEGRKKRKKDFAGKRGKEPKSR